MTRIVGILDSSRRGFCNAARRRLGVDARTILEAIEGLPEDERAAFSLVKIQGMMPVEAAEVLGVSTKTVQRKVNRALLSLGERLEDLRPTEAWPAGPPSEG